jgi:hypothetical protein
MRFQFFFLNARLCFFMELNCIGHGNLKHFGSHVMFFTIQYLKHHKEKGGFMIHYIDWGLICSYT